MTTEWPVIWIIKIRLQHVSQEHIVTNYREKIDTETYMCIYIFFINLRIGRNLVFWPYVCIYVLENPTFPFNGRACLEVIQGRGLKKASASILWWLIDLIPPAENSNWKTHSISVKYLFSLPFFSLPFISSGLEEKLKPS